MSGTPPPAAPQPRRRRRWKILLGLAALGLVVVFGPIAAAPLVKARIVAEINRDIDGYLELGELSLNPFGGIGVTGFRLLDEAGQPVVLARRAWADTSLLSLLAGRLEGFVEIEGVEIHLRPEHAADLRLDPQELARAGGRTGRSAGRVHLHDYPEVRGTIEVRDSRLVVHDGAGHLSVLDLKLGAVVDGLDSPAYVSALLATRDEHGSTGSMILGGELQLSDGSHIDADTLEASLRLDLERLDLSALAGWFEPDPSWEGLAGLADGWIQLDKRRGDAVRLEADLAVERLRSLEFQSDGLKLTAVAERLAEGEREQRRPANLLRLQLAGLEAREGLGPLLRRVHPMFAGRAGAGAALPGSMDLALELAFPAPLSGGGEAPLAPLRGHGELRLAAASLSGSPFLIEMLDLAGAGEQAALGLTPLRFVVTGDRLRYAEPWAVQIGDRRTRFQGEVGADGALALEWLVPVDAALASRHFALRGRDGEVVVIPVTGTLERPQLDWAGAADGSGLTVPLEPVSPGEGG